MRQARGAAPAAGTEPYAAMILRRTGLRPLRFRGRVLLQAEDSAEPGWSRIRLAVYRTAQDGFVFEIFGVPGGGRAVRPWSLAASVPSLAAGVACLETAEPRPEAAGIVAADEDVSAMLRDCVSRWQIEGMQTHAMRHAIGGFLHRLYAWQENCGDAAW